MSAKIRSGLAIFFLLGVLSQVFAAGTLTNRQHLFVENKGQFIDQDGKANTALLFVADMAGMKIHIRKDGFSYEKIQSAGDSLHPVQSYRTDIKIVNASIIEITIVMYL